MSEPIRQVHEKYELIIAFEGRAGNWNREYTAWVFGVVDESDVGIEFREWIEADARYALQQWVNPDVGAGALQMVHGEHCWVWQELIQGGDAISYDLTRMLTKQELAVIQERSDSFPQVFSELNDFGADTLAAPVSLQIKRKQTTVETETVLTQSMSSQS